METEFNKTPAKANRWFRAFMIFAVLYGITFSLSSFFNWVFFCAASYSLFMSYFLLPQQPKIFQKRAGQSRNFSGGSRPGAQGYSAGSSESSSSENVNPVDKQKKLVTAIVAGIFAFVFIFMMIGFFADDDTATTTENYDTSETASVTLVDKGNGFYNDQNYDSADWYYDKALLDNPNDGAALYGKGIVMYSKQRMDDCYTYLLKAHEQGFEHAWLSWTLADMYDKRGQSSRAIEFYKESASLDSVCSDCYKRLAELEPGNSAAWLKLADKYK